MKFKIVHDKRQNWEYIDAGLRYWQVLRTVASHSSHTEGALFLEKSRDIGFNYSAILVCLANIFAKHTKSGRNQNSQRQRVKD